MQDFKLWWDDENQIIRQNAPNKIHDTETSEIIIKAVFDMLMKYPGAPILVRGTEMSFLTKGGGEMFREAMLSDTITKVAYMDCNPIIEYDISYLSNSFPEPERLLKKFKLFTDEVEAIAWLKS